MNSYRPERGNDFYSGSYRNDHYGNRSSKYSDHTRKKKSKKKRSKHDLTREQKVEILYNHLLSKGETQYDKSQLEALFQDGIHNNLHINHNWKEAIAAYNSEDKDRDSKNLEALMNPSISYVPKEMKENKQSGNHHQRNNYQYGDCNVDNPNILHNDYVNQSQTHTSYPIMPLMKTPHSSVVPPPPLMSLPPTQHPSYVNFSILPPKIPQPSPLAQAPKENLNTISNHTAHPHPLGHFSSKAGYNPRQAPPNTDGNKDLYNHSGHRISTRHQILRNEIPKCHGFSSKENNESDLNQRQVCITRKEDLDPWGFFPDKHANLKKELPMDAIRMTDDQVWFERHIYGILQQESDFFGPYHLKLYEQTLNAKCKKCINGIENIGLVDYQG